MGETLMVNATIVFAVLSLAPLACGALAFAFAAILAAFAVRAAEAPIAADDSAEWLESMIAWDAAADVDAEWIALANAPEAAPVPVLTTSTRATVAAFRAERAAVDAWIAARPAAALAPEVCPLAPRYVSVAAANASRGMAAARKRIAARVTREVHTAEATTLAPSALTSGGKLTRGAAFAADAKRAIAAHTARRTLYPTLAAAFEREWCEAFASTAAPLTECGEAAAAYETLGSLATLARMRGDAPEAAAIEACETSAYLAALQAAA